MFVCAGVSRRNTNGAGLVAAKGDIHLTGGHNLQNIQRDARPLGVDLDLLRGGVGLVHTIVQVLQQSGQGELGRLAESFQALAETHYLSGDLGLALEKLDLALQHSGSSSYLKESITARETELQREWDNQKTR